MFLRILASAPTDDADVLFKVTVYLRTVLLPASSHCARRKAFLQVFAGLGPMGERRITRDATRSGSVKDVVLKKRNGVIIFIKTTAYHPAYHLVGGEKKGALGQHGVARDKKVSQQLRRLGGSDTVKLTTL
eukprot:6194091-Pleurochrysis_carterae.AAC.2